MTLGRNIAPRSSTLERGLSWVRQGQRKAWQPPHFPRSWDWHHRLHRLDLRLPPRFQLTPNETDTKPSWGMKKNWKFPCGYSNPIILEKRYSMLIWISAIARAIPPKTLPVNLRHWQHVICHGWMARHISHLRGGENISQTRTWGSGETRMQRMMNETNW